MAFVRKRGNSHQLIATYRDGGTVRQRVIANLGRHRSLAAAIEAEPEKYARYAKPSRLVDRHERNSRRNAFMLRADQAGALAFYKGRVDAKILASAEYAANAWRELFERLSAQQGRRSRP